LWSARADEALAAGEKVRVVARDGLTLKVIRA
jgi:membrane protein implicated in regulation of membrane protease activity